jgi:stage V sporulation protein B
MPDFRVSAVGLRRRLKSSLSMGYASLMSQVYGQMDQLMLGYLSTARDAGEYAAAYRIPNAVLTFAGSWTGVVFPHTAELAGTDRTRLRSQAAMMVTAIAMFSLPLAACAPFVADGLMTSAFGSQFGPAGPTFALLSVGLALALIDGTLSTLAVALGGDRSYASAVTATAIFNVALNVAVIPLLGRNGAAIDTIVAESLLFYRLARVTNARLGGLRVDWNRLLRAFVAVSAAAGSLALVPAGDLSVWLRVAMGAGVYAGGLVLFGAVRRDEIRSMFSRRATSAPAPDQAAPRPMSSAPGPLDLDMDVEWVPHLTSQDLAAMRRRPDWSPDTK